MHLTDVEIGIASAVRDLRKRAGFTQNDMAQRLGITMQQMQKYEAARNRISAGRLLAIAKILHVPVDAFFPACSMSERQPEQLRMDPEKVVLAFLSNSDNWRLFCAFRRVLDPNLRSQIIRIAEQSSQNWKGEETVPQ